MRLRTSLWLVPLLGLLAAPVSAGHGHGDGDRYGHRHDRQHHRIEHGVRKGSLTHKEAKRLRREQRHIHKPERHFERDGHLDRFERRTLRHEYDTAGRHIGRLKHNDRYRHHYGHGFGKHDHHGHRSWRRHKGHHDHGYRPYAKHRYFSDDGWALKLKLWDLW